MKLREIILATAIGASALVGCKEEPNAMLEPIAVAWSTGSSANYRKVEDARRAVYRVADINTDEEVTYSEAKAMVERCPKRNGYKCN